MIHVKQNDRRPTAPAVLKRGNNVVNLTTANQVTFKMRPIHGIDLKVNAEATVLAAASGSVEYRWADGDTDIAGEYLAEWEVTWSDGTTETFPTIDYDIVLITSDLDGS